MPRSAPKSPETAPQAPAAFEERRIDEGFDDEQDSMDHLMDEADRASDTTDDDEGDGWDEDAAAPAEDAETDP